ncbi:restriction endonuclease subunit S [Ligilactobacillus ruminis]|nr:restriction endonuclease subunit S [Ligilactobacillus ruminis]
MKCKLSDICDFRKGKVDVSKLTLKTYISTENMLPNKGGITDASSLPTIQLTQEYKKGDVLISNIRPYFKKVWRAKYDGGCSNDVLVFQGNSNIDGDFLYYVLANDDFFDYSMATSKGTKMPRGDKASIMQYEVPVFDVDTQRKIASVLRCLDEKIELNSVINKNLFEQVQTIYKDRYINLSPFDRTIPVGWHVGTASEIIEFHDSKRIPLSSREREKLDKIYPYYGATSMMDYVDHYLFDGIYLLLGEDGTVMDDKGFPILQYVEGKFLFISVFFTIFLSKLLRIQAIFLCVARSGISISKFSISEGLIAGYADAVCSATA